MPPSRTARTAGAVVIAAALGVIAASLAGMQSLVIISAVVGAAAGAAILMSGTAPESVAEPAAAPETPPRRKAEPSATVLLATLRNMSEGSERLLEDLHRILAGIVSDERCRIDRSETHKIVASFARSDHAGAAIHAAQRMLSNVDALRGRLGHDIGIVIAVHSGPKGEEAVNVAARIQEAATVANPVLISEPAARHLGNAMEKVDTVSADGWQLDVFTFPPAQKRLPGF